MGVPDYLTCEVELPGLGLPIGVEFQTHLFELATQLTITRGGRLIEHASGSEETGEMWECGGVMLPRYRRVPLGDRDLEYHGDLRFGTTVEDSGFVEFVARFTNGTLEWVRPLAELPELHRLQLLSRA